MNFDAVALDAWVALCNQQTQMRNEGASQEAIDALNVRIICAMVALLPDTSDETKAALALLMLSNSAPSEPSASAAAADPTDPLPPLNG
jgi:hypothetical protein